MRRRSGISLVEMSVVIAMATTMLAISVGLLQVLLRTSRTVGEDLTRHTSTARLADAFRQDAHAATALRPVKKEKNVWEFDLGDGRAARYRLEQGSLVRTVHDGKAARSRNSFRLPDGAEVSVTSQPEGSETLVMLAIVSGAESSKGRTLRIAARLAADRRFQQTKSEK